jgi:hypothetical protein
MKPTHKQVAAIALYAAIMEEAKIRLNSIDMALGGVTILPHQLVREFCYLQLRMLCELIALGALTAHGDIEETTKLKNVWSADKIIDRLEQLHPDFYPMPVIQNSIGPGKYHFDQVKDGFLTKEELVILNGKSGAILHRGTMKKLLSTKTPLQKNFPDIVDWGQKVSTLLNHHCIHLADGDVVVCMLRNASDNNRVQVVMGVKVGPDGLSIEA